MLPGLYYNPYFAGGAIGMPAPLMDEQVEYPMGPCRRISNGEGRRRFLVAEPEHDERKKGGFRWITRAGAGGAGRRVYETLSAGRTSRRARSRTSSELVRPRPDHPVYSNFPQVAVAASMACREGQQTLKLVWRQNGDRDARGLCETLNGGR